MAPCRDGCALAAASLRQEGVPPQCTGERTLGACIQWVTELHKPHSRQTANPQPGEILHRKRSQGLWPVSSQGALQGSERDSQPDAKGEMDALSSSHFKKAGLPLPYLGNFERRLEKGTKHMLGGRGVLPGIQLPEDQPTEQFHKTAMDVVRRTAGDSQLGTKGELRLEATDRQWSQVPGGVACASSTWQPAPGHRGDIGQ